MNYSKESNLRILLEAIDLYRDASNYEDEYDYKSFESCLDECIEKEESRRKSQK